MKKLSLFLGTVICSTLLFQSSRSAENRSMENTIRRSMEYTTRNRFSPGLLATIARTTEDMNQRVDRMIAERDRRRAEQAQAEDQAERERIQNMINNALINDAPIEVVAAQVNAALALAERHTRRVQDRTAIARAQVNEQVAQTLRERIEDVLNNLNNPEIPKAA